MLLDSWVLANISYQYVIYGLKHGAHALYWSVRTICSYFIIMDGKWLIINNLSNAYLLYNNAVDLKWNSFSFVWSETNVYQ